MTQLANFGGGKVKATVVNDYSLLSIYTELPGLSLTARFYTDAPAPKGGSGGYTAVPRPLDSAVTAWTGFTDSYTMPLNIILDSYTASPARDVEADINTLEKMAGTFTRSEPPLLILNAGGALQHDVVNRPKARWVVNDSPDWGEVLRNAQGRRVRQVVTVPFMLYVPYDALSRTKSTADSAPRNTFMATAAVDTFKKAAAHYLNSYGGAKWANRLAQLNGARDGAAKLKLGQRYTLPTVTQIKSWEKTPRR